MITTCTIHVFLEKGCVMFSTCGLWVIIGQSWYGLFWEVSVVKAGPLAFPRQENKILGLTFGRNASSHLLLWSFMDQSASWGAQSERKPMTWNPVLRHATWLQRKDKKGSGRRLVSVVFACFFLWLCEVKVDHPKSGYGGAARASASSKDYGKKT